MTMTVGYFRITHEGPDGELTITTIRGRIGGTMNSMQLTYDGKLHEFIGEASTLGLKPGFEPKRLQIDHEGNKITFQLTYTEVNDGDIRWWLLKEVNGTRTLRIFND
jgi:hypothetical protein